MSRHRRERFVKRDRVVHRNRLPVARVYRLSPDHALPFKVEVRIARDWRRMRDEMRRLDGERFGRDLERDCMGLVRHYRAVIGGRCVIRPGGVVARMFLNARDLQRKPSEIVAHECTHAGMAWARIRRANLRHMAGEEVLCYAVGRLVKQVNRACFAMGVFR